MTEILAPAGDEQTAYAALRAGADAVYLGLTRFSARESAENFCVSALRKLTREAHLLGAKVYVALNTLIREEEVPAFFEAARAAWDGGADAILLQDIFLGRALKEMYPQMVLHLSTQAGVMSAAGARLAARELGVERATCARELSLGELAELCDEGVPIEAFCHGAICICYSGACSFSALRRGRSANRGDCTQPCRLAYSLEDGEGHPVARVAGDRLLCPRDYCSIDHLEELVHAGVSALKIEGRMKNPDYVYNVVRTYREALDALCCDKGFEEDAEELRVQLGRSFNRGFTDAYLRGESGAELMSFERAINQGVRVGTVVERGYHEVVVALDRAVAAGDTLEIRTILPADAAPDVPARWPLVPCEVDGAPAERIRVRCKRRVAPGSPVYLTASAAVRAEADAAVAKVRAGLDATPEVPMTDATACDEPVRPNASERGGCAVPPAISVIVSSLAMARRLLDDERVAAVCVRATRLPEEPDVAWPLSSMTVILDEPCRIADEGRTRKLCRQAASVVCRNLGAIELAREEGAAFEVAAPVSATNSETVRWLVGLGARRVWLPDELMAKEACDAMAAAPAGACGVQVYGVPQLMVCEHCLLTAEGPCDGDHGQCARRRAKRFLVEADGSHLLVHVDSCGRTRIFDERPLDRLPDVSALCAAGVGALLLDADLLGEDETMHVLDCLASAADSADSVALA